ncbi:hypothetical protein D3C84_1234850 [compost metagenome]
MGDVGVEGFQAAVGQVDAFQGRVEGAGELRQLRRQVGQLQAPAQARRRQLLGFGRERQQRPQANPRDPVTEQ